MKQSESVSHYNDRVQGLLSGARQAIEEKYTGTYGHVKESLIMIKPVINCVLDAFITINLMQVPPNQPQGQLLPSASQRKYQMRLPAFYVTQSRHVQRELNYRNTDLHYRE